MFEINLIQEHVTPRSWRMKRFLVVVSYFSVIVLATLIVVNLSLAKKTEVKEWEDAKRAATEAIDSLKGTVQELRENQRTNDRDAQTLRRRLVPFRNRISFLVFSDALCSVLNSPQFAQELRIYRIEYVGPSAKRAQRLNGVPAVLVAGWYKPKSVSPDQRPTVMDTCREALKNFVAALQADKSFTQLSHCGSTRNYRIGTIHLTKVGEMPEIPGGAYWSIRFAPMVSIDGTKAQ